MPPCFATRFPKPPDFVAVSAVSNRRLPHLSTSVRKALGSKPGSRRRKMVEGWILLIAAAAFAAGYGVRWLVDEPVDDVPPISPEAFLVWWMDGRPLRGD